MSTDKLAKQLDAQDQTLARLNRIWHKFPDLRLMQLIVGAGAHDQGISKDSFYLTDDKLIEMLEAFVEKQKL